MIVKVAAVLGVTPCYVFGADPVDLSQEEERLFRKWRALPPTARREVETFLKYLGSKAGAAGRSAAE